MLAAAKPDPRFKVYGNVAPDPESFEFHVAVEALLEGVGFGKDYDAEQYSQAGELIQKAREAEPETGAIVLASEICKRAGQRETPGSLFYAERAVLAIAAEAEEKRATGVRP